MKKLPKKVLVIDDEPQLRQLLRSRLESSSYECFTAEDPAVGMDIAGRVHPDLILLDLMLPKMSGLGCLRELKRNHSLSHIPVLVLTALGDEEIAREAMDLGAAAYVTKTCNPQSLMDMVQEYTHA